MRLDDFSRPNTRTANPTVENTLAAMARLARQAQSDVAMRLWVESLVAKLRPRDGLSELAAITFWVLSHVRYLRDPVFIQQVKTPRVTVETGAGNCVDMATLLAAMAGLLGMRSRVVAVGYAGAPPSHAWAEAAHPESRCWIVLDPVSGQRGPELTPLLIPAAEAAVKE